MSKYSTGELAKQCDVSVRTVQFYDTKGLLVPSELSEGGRRLYTENDMKKLKSICLLKTLGLSLNTIKEIQESKNPDRLMVLLLEEQKHQIDNEIDVKRNQIDAINTIIDNLAKSQNISVGSICDMENIMNGKKKLRKTYIVMLTVGSVMTAIEVATIYLWITRGMWWAFAICVPLIIICSILLVKMYYRNTMYICPECGLKFKPNKKEFFWASHTPKTRKLTCTGCGYKGFCVETYSD